MVLGSKLSGCVTQSGWGIVSAGAATAAIVGFLKFGAVSFLLHLNAPRDYLRMQDAILTGLLAAAAVCAVLWGVKQRRKYVRGEIQTVANLNHELRNALEVIIGSEYLAQSSKGEAILESVERINRALNNILGSQARKARP